MYFNREGFTSDPLLDRTATESSVLPLSLPFSTDKKKIRFRRLSGVGSQRTTPQNRTKELVLTHAPDRKKNVISDGGEDRACTPTTKSALCPLGAMKLEILQALCQNDGQEIFQWQVALEIGTGLCRGFHLFRRCLDRSWGMKSRRQAVGLLGYFFLARPVFYGIVV